MKSKNILAIVVLIISILSTQVLNVQGKNLGIYLDDNKVPFSKQMGFPYIEEGRTQIPLRALGTAFGAEVWWDSQSRIAYAKKNGVTIGAPIDKRYVMINGEYESVESKNRIVDGRTYVPLRIMIESFNNGKGVSWDATNYAVRISSQQDVVDKPVSVDTGYSLRGIQLGHTKAKLVQVLGEPNRKDPSLYGFTWYVYNDDYSKYLQVGVKDDTVVALYTNASYWSMGNEFKYGATENQIQQVLGNNYQVSMRKGNTIYNGEHQRIYTKDNKYVTLYFDQHDSNRATSVLIVDKTVEDGAKYFADNQQAMKSSYERQILDLTNVERINKGLNPLTWNVKVANVARAHSKDMATAGYFNHTNKQGLSPFKRASQAGIQYRSYGENIAMGQRDPFQVVHGLMNSKGHRDNILGSSYKGLGVGVWMNSSNNQPYYTQNFIL